MPTLARVSLVFAACAALVAVARADLPVAADLRNAFQQLDTDRNERINETEWENASFALFHRCDKNQDDTLELTEILHEALAASTFVRADENGDRRIDLNEYSHLRRAIFYTADIDRNDAIDFTEFELLRLLGEVGWTDVNKNHRIEFSELQASLGLVFAKADQNKDGQLTAAEATFLQPDTFAAIAKDGAVDLETLVASYKRRLLYG